MHKILTLGIESKLSLLLLKRIFALTMKIAYDAKRYYHNRTGLGNYSRTLVSCMASRHEDVEAVLYDSKSLERTFRLGRKAAGEGCELFHGLNNELPRDIMKAGIPSIVTMHDVAWRTFPDMYKPWDRLIYDWKYGWSARHASHVVCISESTKRDVMHYYNVPEERISVIYQPVQEQRRLNMLLAVLEKRVGFKLMQKDVFLNIAGGLRVTDMAMDLSVIAAVLSSNVDTPIESGWCMAGEVGLSGEVRPVARIEQRIAEAEKLGFSHIIIPKYNLSGLNRKKFKIELVPVRKVEEALRALFG